MDINAPLTQRLDPFGAGLNTGVNDLYTPFLGPMPQPSRTDPYERRNVDKWNMPENYRGKNAYLRDTVEDLLWTANETWYTTVILPWEVTDDIHLQWTNLQANAHFLDTTPYQAPSPLVTQERQIRRASLVRRGIAAEFEHDFLRTPLGRVSFLAALNQMARSVQETANAECIRALINAHHFQHQWLREHGIIKEHDLKGYFERDRSRFAIAQKTKNGLEKLDMEIDKELRMWQGQADAWILPEEVMLYTTIVPPEKTDYFLAGILGPDRVNNEGNKQLARAGTTDPQDRVEPRRMVSNSPVYIARSFNVPNAGQLDLLSRVRQVGEYNTMIDECLNYSTYTSASRAIAIYNEDIDDFSQISLEDAIEHCGLWDQNGNVIPVGFDGRRGGAGQNMNDARRDFLSYFNNGVVVTANVLNQIDPFYLPVKKVIAAAKTIENALVKQGFNTENVRNSIAAANVTGEIVADSDASHALNVLKTMLNSAFAIETVLRRAQGEDVQGEGVQGGEDDYHMMMNGKVPVVKIGDNAGQSELAAADIDQQFIEMLGTMVPKSKRDEVSAIGISDMPMEAKIEAIKQKCKDYIDEKERGLKLKSHGKVEDFFKTRTKEYQALRSQAQATGASPSISGKIAKYMEPGQNLEGTGFKYLYEGSKRRTTGNRTIDRNTHLRVLSDRAFDLEQAARQSGNVQSRVTDTGAGLGLEGISAMAYGKRDKRERIPSEELRKIYERLELELKHTEEIDRSGASFFHKILAKLFLQVPMTKQSMLNLARHDILVPLNFLLFRPHIQYKTRMGIKVATGGRAGRTYYGHSGMQIQHEAGRKIAHMHYTTHMRSVVTQPKNVYVQPDLFCQEYLGGNNVEFFDHESYKLKDNEHLRQSIICVAIPPAETKIPSPMDASGRFYVEYNAGLLRKEDFEELHYSTAFRYNHLYGFHMQAKKQGTDLPNFKSQYSHDNRAMYQGMQIMYNTKTNSFDKVRTNKGHRGKNIYAGVGEVFNGQLKEIEIQDFSKFSIM